MSVDLLVRQAERLRAGVAVWSEGRWTAPPRSLPELLPTATTCAGVAAHLIQILADLGADAEGRPRRPVPSSDSSLALPDQLVVMAYDIASSDPAEPLVRAALTELLLHRAEIDSARPAPDAISFVLGCDASPEQLLHAAAAGCPARIGAGPS